MIWEQKLFYQIGETTDMVLVPPGARKAGTALKAKDNSGCTAIVTLDMISNRALYHHFLYLPGVLGRLT